MSKEKFVESFPIPLKHTREVGVGVVNKLKR